MLVGPNIHRRSPGDCLAIPVSGVSTDPRISTSDAKERGVQPKRCTVIRYSSISQSHPSVLSLNWCGGMVDVP